MRISRRAALSGTASLIAAAPAGAAVAAPARPGADSEDFGALPSKQQIWEEMLFLTECGSRNTGFPGHHKFIDHLEAGLKQCPGVVVSRDNYSLDRWEADRYALSARTPGGSVQALHATSYYPSSGRTSPAGITAPLVDLGRTTPNEIGGSNPVPIPGDIRGKIVLVRSPVHGFPYAANFKVWGTSHPDATFPDRIKEAIWQNRAAPPLDQFKAAGAVGAIYVWEGISDENAEGQYAPFGRPNGDFPCLWVGEATGNALAGVAARGGEATVVLEATISPNTPTDTLYGMLPGQSDEIILIHTHSDGPNAVEENAPIGVVALAKYLSNLPRGTLRRTYLFTMTTGHMANTTAHSWRGFVEKHPDLVKRCVGALVLEHLGARSWIDRNGAYLPSGENQTTLVITQSGTLADLALRSCAGTIDDRLVAVNPYMRRYTGESGGVIEAGIPCIGIMPVPSYLLKDSRHGSLEKIDPRHFRAQLENFTRMLRRMDRMSKEQFAGTMPL